MKPDFTSILIDRVLNTFEYNQGFDDWWKNLPDNDKQRTLGDLKYIINEMLAG